MESRKMVSKILFAKQKQTHRCRKQIHGYQGWKWGWEEPGDWNCHIHTTMVTDNHCKPSAGHGDLYSGLCGDPPGEGI